MDFAQTVEYVVAFIVGGALSKVVDSMIKWRKASSRDRLLEVKIESAEASEERKATTFALGVLRDQVSALQRDVLRAREDNQKLADEHMDCRRALQQFETKAEAKAQKIAQLEKQLAEQGLDLRVMLSLLEKHTDLRPDDIAAERQRMQVLLNPGGV